MLESRSPNGCSRECIFSALFGSIFFMLFTLFMVKLAVPQV